MIMVRCRKCGKPRLVGRDCGHCGDKEGIPMTRWLLATAAVLIASVAIVIILMAPTASSAQTVYYGPTGQYLGQSVPVGQGTVYYGPTGQMRGMVWPLTPPPVPMTPWMPPPVVWAPTLPSLPTLPAWGQ